MHDICSKLTSGSSDGDDGLCFDKNEFMKVNFSVDEFLHQNRHAPSLEQLRDNLGLYLKGLRSSMIDLINEDYADFVNLSANLVGLDQSIETIQRPLGNFRSEIENMEALIRENENEIRSQLERKSQLRDLRRNMQSLKKVYSAIQKLEDLLSNQLSEKVRSIDLERAALELIQLKFNKKFCEIYLKEEHQNIIRKQELSIHEKLRQLFIASLKEAASAKSTDQLERCLRIYITLDACHLAETVFRDDVVGPYMSNTISEQSLQNSPQGLGGIYSKILNFIPLHMTDLLRLTQYTDKLLGFNFLVNSFWADIEMRIETHMTSIFAPGNSDVFFAKYKCTREFLLKIEELLASEEDVKKFRQHHQLKSFGSRWNLPVYFQICFQEIAGELESSLEPLLHADSINHSSDATAKEYKIKVFNSTEKAITRCWSDGVYIAEIFPKFYKLNVQIITRLSRWIKDVLRTLNSSNAFTVVKMSKTQIIVILHCDIQGFIDSLGGLKDLIIKKLPKNQQLHAQLVKETIDNSFEDLRETFSVHLNAIQNTLVELLISESSSENLRQVNDLPRLYRKTNREVPTRCCSYVEQMLRPLKSFYDEQGTILGSQIVQNILNQVCSRITAEYFTAISDVLTSVQKTEESLRRLRNLKSSGNATSSTTGGAMTDDDKIRLQLRVDVIAWTTELGKLGIMPTDITKLSQLNNMVEDSIKMKDNNLTNS